MALEIVWTTVAFIGFCRGLMLLREARRDRAALGEHANGRRIIANGQVEHAYLGVLIYFLLLGAGLSAVFYRFEFISLKWRLLAASLCLVVALFTLAFRQERDAYYRRKLLDGYDPLTQAEQMERVQEATEDTNQRVREIQSRGLSDQPAEEEDRRQGKEHRER